MLFRILLLLVCSALSISISAQSNADKPKLVVGIVVDQMRYEYLNRFDAKFGADGFKRLRGDGFELKNAHYNYVPTETGSGHASIYAGTTPAMHGIIANDWYDKKLHSHVNCVSDPKQRVIGTDKGKGQVSPWRLLTTTITDELKLATQKRSKVIGVSLKDRGAVLPGGHMADAAYWYDDNTGKFISSTYYFTDKLPGWATDFNKQNLANAYLNQVWNTTYPIAQYKESGPDDSPYEVKYAGIARSIFPYNLKELRKTNGDFSLLWATPFGNDYVAEFAKAAIVAEKMGQGTDTDFLAISFSSTDAIGHRVGPQAVEIEDTYIRLDKNIADLLATLDKQVGAGNYTVFLTSDHGVNDVAQSLIDNRIPAGYLNQEELVKNLKLYLNAYFPNKEIIEEVSNEMVYFNTNNFQNNPREAGIDFLIAAELINKYLVSIDGIANVFTESVIRQGNYDEGGLKGLVIRGFNPKRSGDLAYVLEPGWYPATHIQGTSHGSAYSYDTHVPILFYGSNIKKGSSVRHHNITDIAATLAVILQTKFPSACTGSPIEELFE